MAEKKADSKGLAEIDAPAVNALLDVFHKTSGSSHLRAINEVASTELARINAEYEVILRPPPPPPPDPEPEVEGDV